MARSRRQDVRFCTQNDLRERIERGTSQYCPSPLRVALIGTALAGHSKKMGGPSTRFSVVEGERWAGISGGHPGNAGTNVVQISANNKTTNGNCVIERIRRNAHNNGIMDNINGVTLSNPFTALYASQIQLPAIWRKLNLPGAHLPEKWCTR